METGSMMLKHPLFFPFGQPQLFFPFGRRVAVATTQSLTNVQKLSLPANTAVGTQVAVTDGFVVSGSGTAEVNKFWFPVGTNEGKTTYCFQDGSVGADDVVRWANLESDPPFDVPNWIISTVAGRFFYSPEDVEFPWQVVIWIATDDGTLPLPTLTHPALQQLTAPATAQGGVFVAGGSQDGVWVPYIPAPTYNGKPIYVRIDDANADHTSCGWFLGADSGYPQDRWIFNNGADGGDVYYSISNVATPDLAGSDKFVMVDSNDNVYSKRGTFNGKPYYNKLGSSTSTALDAIFWSSATWHITNALGVDADTSTSAVATPDLATFLLGMVVSNVAWLSADDNSVASIIVTSVTVGELNAGLTVTGSGTPEINKVHLKNNSNPNGRPGYNQIDFSYDDLNFSPESLIHWSWAATYPSPSSDTAFPWQATYILDGNPAPVPTVARNDVATEANWEVV